MGGGSEGWNLSCFLLDFAVVNEMLMDYGDFGDSPPITLKPVPRLRGVNIYHLNILLVAL